MGQNNGAIREPDVVVTSRVRLARNIDEFPFPYKMNREQSEKIINKVKETVFENSSFMAQNFEYTNLQEINPLDKLVLIEKHIISPDIAESTGKNGVIISKDEKVSIMINEEDHIRVQCLFPGMHIDEAWKLCSKIDMLLEEKLDFAFSSDLGYLTCCPTNTGTGMRASVMLHLPALVMTGYIKGVLDACGKLGVAVRGLYGEHSEASGNMFQISNQVTLGQSEEEIVASITNVASQIIENERTIRNELYKQNPYKFEDRVFRALGILSGARIISSEESFKMISEVRLGIDMGIIKNASSKLIDELMLLIQPGGLQKLAGRALNPDERDIKRAELIRNRLNKSRGME